MIPRKLTLGIAIAILVNLVLIVVSLWSSGGQVATVRIEIEGHTYRVTIDGEQILPATDPGVPERALLFTPLQGTISLTMLSRVPSMPNPQGVDSIVVTDLEGNELFRDDFDEFNQTRWRVLDGSFRVEDGVLVPLSLPGHNTILLNDDGWGDQIITVKFRNAMALEIGARRSQLGRINFGVDLVRDFPIYMEGYAPNGAWTGTVFGERIHTSKTQIVKSMAAMALRPYPYLALIGVLGVLVAAGLALAENRAPAVTRAATGLRERLESTPRLSQWLPHTPLALAIAGAGLTACLSLYILWVYYDNVPHLPDEASYMFQAKLFAAGKIAGEIPPVQEAFYTWIPNFMVEHDGRWATLYPGGHPLMLAVGEVFGLMWLVPPLIGAGCIVLMFLVGRNLFHWRTGLIAAGLLAVSPFFLMQSSNFMSHNTWAFFLLLSLYFLTQPGARKPLQGVLAGLFFGLMLNTRTVEGVMLLPAFGLLLLSFLASKETRGENVRFVAGFLAGGGFTLLLMLGYNAAITGNPLEPPYVAWGADTIGFTNGHAFDIGLRNLQTQLMALLLILNTWPAWIGLGFILVPFILGSRNKWDYFLAACAFLVAVIYIGYPSSMLYQGPRYWYQAVPFLLLLAARGIEGGSLLLSEVALQMRARFAGDPRPARWTGHVFVYALVAVLVVNGTGGWLFGWNKAAWSEQDVPQVQNNVGEIEFIYKFDDRLHRLADQLQPQNALILVGWCAECYNTVFAANTVNFDGNIVWARYVPGRIQETIDAFPGRTVYIANYGDSTITLYEGPSTLFDLDEP